MKGLENLSPTTRENLIVLFEINNYANHRARKKYIFKPNS